VGRRKATRWCARLQNTTLHCILDGIQFLGEDDFDWFQGKPMDTPEEFRDGRRDAEWGAASQDDVLGNLRNAVERVREQSVATGMDPCSARILAALADENVQTHFVNHVLSNEAFSRAYCLGNFIPEEDRLIFEFICLPPKICLFPFKFLVRLNVMTETVIEVIDPAPALIPVSEQLPGAMFRL
jgi:hypothetical protein